MNHIYRVTIQGRTFESRDLRRLLARAVHEKRSLDRRYRVFAGAWAQRAPSLGNMTRNGACASLG
jgi:hypothetical protein